MYHCSSIKLFPSFLSFLFYFDIRALQLNKNETKTKHEQSVMRQIFLSRSTRSLTFRSFSSSLEIHPNVRVFISDNNRGMVLARMEFDNTLYVGSVSFVYTEIVKVILLHFFPAC